jgi:Xaa-Pro aminopeptidase
MLASLHRPGLCFSIEPTVVIYGQFGMRLEDSSRHQARNSSRIKALRSTNRSVDTYPRFFTEICGKYSRFAFGMKPIFCLS